MIREDNNKISEEEIKKSEPPKRIKEVGLGLCKWLQSPLMPVSPSELPLPLYRDSKFMPHYIQECEKYFESVNVVPFKGIKSIPNDCDESFKWNRYEEIIKECQDTLNFILKNFQFFFRNKSLKEIYLKKYAKNIRNSEDSLVIYGKNYKVMPDEEQIRLKKGTFYTIGRKFCMVADIYDQFVSVLHEYYGTSPQNHCEVPNVPEDFECLLSVLDCETIADLNVYQPNIVSEVYSRDCLISKLSLQKGKDSDETKVILTGTSSFLEKCKYSLYINALTKAMREKVFKYWGGVATTGFKDINFDASIIDAREDIYDRYINEDLVAFCEAAYAHLCDLQIRTGLIPNEDEPTSAAPPPPSSFSIPDYFKTYNSRKYTQKDKPTSEDASTNI